MDGQHDDFREVAHCGGKVTFRVKTNDSGRRVFSVRYNGSSTHPMSLFGVYALPQGIPCATIQIGGIGQAWNAPPYPHCIPVLIGSDSHGLFGHECPCCEGYWRSSGSPSLWPMTCVYCGVRAESWQFLTAAQRRYVSHYADNLMEALDSTGDALDAVIDMDAASDAIAGLKPDFYYAGHTQQTKFTCEACRATNDVRGQFSYCSNCGTRNNKQLLKESLAQVRERLNQTKAAPADALKMAVSVFDSCCRNLTTQLTKRVPLTLVRRRSLELMLFHGMESVDSIDRVFGINLTAGINTADLKFLNMMFHRRHAFEHDGGHATRRYLRDSGDASVAEGNLIREDRENVHSLIGLLNRMAMNFSEGFHELLPPEERPVATERDRQQQLKRGSDRR